MKFNFKTKREKALEKELAEAYTQLFRMSTELSKYKGALNFNANSQFHSILKDSLYEISKVKPIPMFRDDEQPFWAKEGSGGK